MRRSILGSLVVALVVTTVAPASAAISEQADAGTWGTNGRVRAVLHVGGVTYLGGEFTALVSSDGTQTLPRSNLAALDAAGQPLAWNPQANNLVLSLVSDGSFIYAAGKFGNIGKHVAKIGLDGSIKTFVKMDHEVRSLDIQGSTLYMGGQFGLVGNHPQANLAAVTLPDGTLVPTFDPLVNGTVYSVGHFADGNLLIGGSFSSVNGTSTGTVAEIYPNGNLGPLMASAPTEKTLTLHTNGSSAVVGVSQSGNKAVAYGEDGTRLWRVGCNGDIQAIDFTGGLWLLGGHFGHCLGGNIGKLLAVNPNGSINTSYDWHITGGVKGIWAMDATSTKLYAGGDFLFADDVSTLHYAQWTVS
jgi:hypothetical protein